MEEKKEKWYNKKYPLTYSHLGYYAAIITTIIITVVSGNAWYGLATFLGIYAVVWSVKDPKQWP
jgi:hypothetical protein